MPTVPARSQRKSMKGAAPAAIKPPVKPPTAPQPQGPIRRPQMGPAAPPPPPAQQMPIPPRTRVNIPTGAGHMSNASNPLGQGGVGAGQQGSMHVQSPSRQKKGAGADNWIAGAIKKPGALHEDLGVPKGQKIPAKKLNAAARGGGKTAKRAQLAKTLKKF